MKLSKMQHNLPSIKRECWDLYWKGLFYTDSKPTGVRMSDETKVQASRELAKKEKHGLKEVQERPIPAEGLSDNILQVLPSNEEEEKEEILLTTTTSKSLKKPSKTSQRKIQEKTTPLTKISKQLDKQGAQVNKIMQMLQLVQRQIKPAEIHPQLLRQLQFQIKQLQKHVSQIQNGLGTTGKQKKKNST